MSPKKKETPSSRRRALMRNRLDRVGYFDYSEIHKAFGTGTPPKVPSNSLDGDLKALKNVGYDLDKSKEGNTTRITWKDSRAFTVKEWRRKIEASRKQKIAGFVTSLVCGFSDEDSRFFGLEPSSVVTKEKMRDYFDRELAPFPSEVLDKIYALWNSPHRSLAIDSGTTTDEISEVIKGLETPNSRFTHMSIWTNSRSIFSLLGQPRCQIKTIMIGGEQRFRSESVSGDLALRCIEAWDPHFGAALIGATSIDVKGGKIEAYNDSEATLKATLLSRATVRIIVADASKFSWNPVNTGARFSIISPDFVDLIVTDSYSHPSLNREIPKFISKVPVLTPEGLKSALKVKK